MINQNIISKTSKQIVLNFETDLRIAEITSVILLDALDNEITSIEKGIDSFIKALPINREIEDFLLDLGKLAKLVQIPCRVISKQKELLHIGREKEFFILNSLF